MVKSILDSLRLWAFKSLAKHFAGSGWELVECTKSTLKMQMTPSAGVLHTLRIIEPNSLEDELRNREAIGLQSEVQVYFRELQRLIHSTLGRNPHEMGELTTTVSLWAKAPAPHRHVVIDVASMQDPSKLDEQIRLLIEYHDKYVEPLRKKLERLDVLKESDFRIGNDSISFWNWSVTRVAYYQLYSDPGERREFFKSLRKLAIAKIGDATAEDLKPPIFHDMATLIRSGEIRAAKEVMDLIDAFEKKGNEEGNQGQITISR